MNKEEETKLRIILTCMNSKYDERSIEKDLISGFKATGVCPLELDKVLSKLPDGKEPINDENFQEAVNNTLIDFLKEKRFDSLPRRVPPRKRKELKLFPVEVSSGIRAQARAQVLLEMYLSVW